MVPLLAPLQPSFLARDRVTAVGSVRVLDCDAVHRLASFRTTVCAPPARPVKVTGEVAEVNEPPSIWIVWGPVPPEKVAVIVPLPAPLQVRSVLASDKESAAGAV